MGGCLRVGVLAMIRSLWTTVIRGSTSESRYTAVSSDDALFQMTISRVAADVRRNTFRRTAEKVGAVVSENDHGDVAMALGPRALDGAAAIDSLTDQIVGSRLSRSDGPSGQDSRPRHGDERTVSQPSDFLVTRSWPLRPGAATFNAVLSFHGKVSPGEHDDPIVSRSVAASPGRRGRSHVEVPRMAVASTLARLLAPRTGVAAMVLVFSGIVVVLTDSALGTALIQRRTIVEEEPLDGVLDERGDRAPPDARRNRAFRPRARLLGEPEVDAPFAVASVGFLRSRSGRRSRRRRPRHVLQPAPAASDRRTAVAAAPAPRSRSPASRRG